MKKHNTFRCLFSSILISVLILSNISFSFAAKKNSKYEDPKTNEINGLYDYLATDAKMTKLSAKGAILMDANTGQILYSKNGKKKFYPASTTKCMTSLLAVENLNLGDTITYSDNAIFNIEPGSSSVALNVGEKITVDQTLYAMMLESANEACNGVAEQVSGSISSFVDLMNKRAKELGAVNTHFANPNGLYSTKHYSCPHDMALIVRAGTQNPNWVHYSSTTSYVCKPTNKQKETRYWFNHHKMVSKHQGYEYDGVIGGKTGYTVKAHYSLVTYAQRGNMKLITVVMNDDTDRHTYDDTKSLLNYGFNNFTNVSPAVKDQTFDFDNMNYVDTALYLTGTTPPISITADTSSKVTVSKSYDLNQLVGGLSSQIDYKNGKLGTYQFQSNGNVITSFDVNFSYNDHVYRDFGHLSWFYRFHIDYVLIGLGILIALILLVLVLRKVLRRFSFSFRSNSLGVIHSNKNRRRRKSTSYSSYGFQSKSRRRTRRRRHNRKNKKYNKLHF